MLAQAVGPFDIVIVMFYLFVVVGLGWLGYTRTKTASDYLIAGRKIHPFVMAMSYGATFISTSAIVGFGGVAGMFGMKDPLRKEVKGAIKVCRQAGMTPIIVTGDHLLTARAIAKELGFKTGKENVIEGKELDNLSDKEFQERIRNIQI